MDETKIKLKVVYGKFGAAKLCRTDDSEEKDILEDVSTLDACANLEKLCHRYNSHDDLLKDCKDLLAIVKRYEPHTGNCATQADPDDFGHLGCTCEHGKIIKRAKLTIAKAKG